MNINIMPCYAPVKAMLFTKSDGKRSLHFKDFDKQCQVLNGSRLKGISLPCGRCIGCRLERSRQWAVRIMHEAKMHDANSFITLTYNDENVPKDGSLSVSVVQKFLKRLRAKLAPKKIRFFLAGEYGTNFGRPHYHCIIFGEDFSFDRVPLHGHRNDLWDSKTLNDCWGFGYTSIGDVSFDSAAYVANYATKKVIGEGADKHYKGRKPEFLLMSRRPGIGRSWFEKFGSDVFPSDEVIVNGRECRPPRYYDNLYAGINDAAMCRIKEKRELDAEKLEKYVKKVDGIPVEFQLPENRNIWRMIAKESVAKSKLALKQRRLS